MLNWVGFRVNGPLTQFLKVLVLNWAEFSVNGFAACFLDISSIKQGRVLDLMGFRPNF